MFQPGDPPMIQPNITVYGSKSCPDTTRTTDLLEQQNLLFEFKDVDETPEYDGYIAEFSGGKRVIPLVRIDNETLVNPSIVELREAIEFTETPAASPKA